MLIFAVGSPVPIIPCPFVVGSHYSSGSKISFMSNDFISQADAEINHKFILDNGIAKFSLKKFEPRPYVP
jgi:hypothetical protein